MAQRRNRKQNVFFSKGDKKDDHITDNFLISEIPNWEPFLREEMNETDKSLRIGHFSTRLIEIINK